MDLDEPRPAAPPPATEISRPDPAQADRVERGQVLVNVPRSFYYNRILPRADRREHSLEELQQMAARIKEQIVRAVRLDVPESWVVDVETIPDDVPPAETALLPGPDSRRKVIDWGIVASVAAAVAVVAALGSWIQFARRPLRTVETRFETHTWRYRTDSEAESSSSERVRELVRRDPEAAASVLQRWTAQRERVS
jgi:hypothetical protein